MHNEEVKEIKNKEKMQSVMLNVQHEKDIYAAWEQAYHDADIEFKVDEGQDKSPTQVKANKVSWLESLPNVMILQMNRVKFEKNLPVKTNHSVPILPEIYPDRFLMQNRDAIERLNNEVNEKRQQTAYLDKCLADYRQFGGSENGGPINSALDMVCELLKN